VDCISRCGAFRCKYAHCKGTAWSSFSASSWRVVLSGLRHWADVIGGLRLWLHRRAFCEAQRPTCRPHHRFRSLNSVCSSIPIPAQSASFLVDALLENVFHLVDWNNGTVTSMCSLTPVLHRSRCYQQSRHRFAEVHHGRRLDDG